MLWCRTACLSVEMDIARALGAPVEWCRTAVLSVEMVHAGSRSSGGQWSVRPSFGHFRGDFRKIPTDFFFCPTEPVARYVSHAISYYRGWYVGSTGGRRDDSGRLVVRGYLEAELVFIGAVSATFSPQKTFTAWSKLSREGALLSVGSERPAQRNEHACGERGPLAGPRPAALLESCSLARQGHAEMEVRRANPSEVVELNPPRAGDVQHTFSRPLSFERGRPTLRVRVSASLVPESRGSVPGSHGCSSRSRAGDAGTVTGGVDVARPGRVR